MYTAPFHRGFVKAVEFQYCPEQVFGQLLVRFPARYEYDNRNT